MGTFWWSYRVTTYNDIIDYGWEFEPFVGDFILVTENGEEIRIKNARITDFRFGLDLTQQSGTISEDITIVGNNKVWE